MAFGCLGAGAGVGEGFGGLVISLDGISKLDSARSSSSKALGSRIWLSSVKGGDHNSTFSQM